LLPAFHLVARSELTTGNWKHENRQIPSGIGFPPIHFTRLALHQTSLSPLQCRRVGGCREGVSPQLDGGNHMMITLAGAMSTAELGLSLAEMIRQDKVHLICCTGANLEEDVFNLVAHDYYERVPNYREVVTRRTRRSCSSAISIASRIRASRTRSDAPHGKGDARSLDDSGQKR
jgi:hypothetical protein